MVDSEAVEKICAQIREDGEREVASILEKARRTAQEIIEKAERERDRIAAQIMEEARERGEIETRRLLSSVAMEVRRARLRAREEVVAAAEKQVETKLGSMRGSPRYPRVLTGLVAEALRMLDGKSFVVQADKRDIELLDREIFPRLKRELAAEGRPVSLLQARPLEKSSLGGTRVGVPGGNVIFDNTFEARMFRFRERIRALVIDEVFYTQDGKEQRA